MFHFPPLQELRVCLGATTHELRSKSHDQQGLKNNPEKASLVAVVAMLSKNRMGKNHGNTVYPLQVPSILKLWLHSLPWKFAAKVNPCAFSFQTSEQNKSSAVWWHIHGISRVFRYEIYRNVSFHLIKIYPKEDSWHKCKGLDMNHWIFKVFQFTSTLSTSINRIQLSDDSWRFFGQKGFTFDPSTGKPWVTANMKVCSSLPWWENITCRPKRSKLTLTR